MTIKRFLRTTRDRRTVGRRAILAVFIVCAGSNNLAAQTSRRPAVPSAPAPVTRFLKSIGPEPSGEEILTAAKEALWEVYLQDDSLKESLVAFVASAPDSPGVAYAAIALIPFHDPRTVRPIVDRALDRRTSNTTRWYLLNSAPYVLAIGDGMYLEDGALDADSIQFAKDLLKYGERASKSGLGHAHAAMLKELYDQATRKVAGNDDYALGLWHLSAYLVGTLDLRDNANLAVFLKPEQDEVFFNVLGALSFASNRDFAAGLRNKQPEQITRKIKEDAGVSAQKWWESYSREHPDGNWIGAVVSGFRDSGYKITEPPEAPANTPEFLRAMDSESQVTRYNAYRLLNHVYRTHFDLERIFFAGKYALSFLDPIRDRSQNEERLKAYWQKRLGPK